MQSLNTWYKCYDALCPPWQNSNKPLSYLSPHLSGGVFLPLRVEGELMKWQPVAPIQPHPAHPHPFPKAGVQSENQQGLS